MKLFTQKTQLIADTLTPVGLYLTLRDQFPKSLLLESSDYHGKSNNYSFICLQPIVNYMVDGKTIKITDDNGQKEIALESRSQVLDELSKLISSIDIDHKEAPNGFFGYTSYDAVKYFDTLSINEEKKDYSVPEMYYSFFKYIIQFDHFSNTITILENTQENEESSLEELKNSLMKRNFVTHAFKQIGAEESNITDEKFKEMVNKGKDHCKKGDVFQIVLSRQFSQAFKGDEFNVYRALRSINPSPYLFYLDFGGFKLFGSSPEAQLKAEKGKVMINPIAGTLKRGSNESEDQKLAKQLAADPKENAEHTMLVDLARNDLSRNGKNVQVKTYKETQFYSHVIHLVSEVEAETEQPLQVFADTFPAGTLSGAPKYRAMELINDYENQHRGVYGGAVGMFGLDGEINQCITIRSFLSKSNQLFYQAGAGVVVDSVDENELQEVNNKLGALKQALNLAENI